MKNKFFCLLLVCLSGLYSAARPPSLANVGNTCYFNSIIQNIYNFEPVTRALIAQKTAPESKFMAEYIPLIKRFRAGEVDGFGPELAALNKTITDLGVEIRPGQQEDTTEAFGYIVNFTDKNGKIQTILAFSNSMGFVTGKKIMVFADQGGTGSQPNKLKEVSRQDMGLSLNLIPAYPGTALVTQYIIKNMAFAPEPYAGDLGEGAMFTYIVGACPEILMIWVKVFKGEFNQATQTFTPSRIATNFDGESFLKPLDISEYVVEDSTGFKDQDTVYNLIGVSCQSGGLGGGHYTALIKDQYDPDRPWYYCSDSTVNAIDAKQVAQDIKSSGYVFFYRKKSAEELSINQQRTERLLHKLAQALKQLTKN